MTVLLLGTEVACIVLSFLLCVFFQILVTKMWTSYLKRNIYLMLILHWQLYLQNIDFQILFYTLNI